MTKYSRDLQNKFPLKFNAIITDTDCSLDKVMAIICLYESWTRKKKNNSTAKNVYVIGLTDA